MQALLSANKHREAICRHWGVQMTLKGDMQAPGGCKTTPRGKMQALGANTHTEGYADTEGCKYTHREDI